MASRGQLPPRAPDASCRPRRAARRERQAQGRRNGILLLGIYSFFVWLIFIKFKWLPWNITSQVIVVTIPIVALTVMILTLNVVAPSSAKLRVFKYMIPIVSQVQGTRARSSR